ncbi:MAG: response regulator transcription factor [Bacteroidota bacterium]
MASSPETTVWIVEDDDRLRETLVYLLDHTTAIACPQAFSSCEEALDMIRAYQARQRQWARPDVLLLDINLPGRSGLDALPQFKALLPDLQIVMLTIRDETDTIFTAFRAGASGYLLKNASVDQIIAAIREARNGGTLMPAPVAKKVLAFFHGQGAAPDYGLSKREKEVLAEMTEGYTQKQIANRLFISANTVNTHIQHIYEKLHVHSGIEAVAKALRERLV